jgi:hypothetical protein
VVVVDFVSVSEEKVKEFEGSKDMYLQRFQDEIEWILESKFQQCQQASREQVVDYAPRLEVFAMKLYGVCIQAKLLKMAVLRQFFSVRDGEI